MTEPILSIEDLVPEDRPYLTINSKPFYFRHPSTLGLADQVRLLRMANAWTRFDHATASDEALVEAAENVKRTAQMMVEDADEEIEALPFGQQVAIVEAWAKVRAAFQSGPVNRAGRRRTSGSSSRPSPASTAPTTG